MLSTLVVSALVAAVPAGPERSIIIVEGYGSVETAPDVASISYDIRGEGTSNDQALSDLVRKSASVETGLRSVDPGIKLDSDGMRVEAVRGKGCDGDRYEGMAAQLSSGTCTSCC